MNQDCVTSSATSPATSGDELEQRIVESTTQEVAARSQFRNESATSCTKSGDKLQTRVLDLAQEELARRYESATSSAPSNDFPSKSKKKVFSYALLFCCFIICVIGAVAGCTA